MRRWLYALIFTVGLFGSVDAHAGDMDFGYTQAPAAGEDPAFLITPQRAIQEIYLEIDAGNRQWTHTKTNLAAGQQVRFSWDRDTSVTDATIFIRAIYPDGFVEELQVPISYSYGGQLSVDLSNAQADLEAHTVSVSVTTEIERADVTAYGARRAVLDQRSIDLVGGPGTVTIPWVGDPEEVVLLDVTVHSSNAWASFTYSPWFLNIPHDDIQFASNSSDIPSDQEWKMTNTLQELQEVIEKYGDLVPVKVFIAGCTDTVGDAAHNRDLSRRRARSIASWLKSNGYDNPVYYHGFGESLLAVRTGDGVDESRNRRALYIVAANPPPAGSGIPQVSWTEL